VAKGESGPEMTVDGESFDDRLAPGAADEFAARGQWVIADGLRLFLLDEGTGFPVLLLHGVPTSSFLWRDVVPVVARTNRALAPDLPGFGYSDKPRGRSYAVPAQADAVAALLDRLGIDRCALVGHDLGALVAADLIAREPERYTHLVVTNTSLRVTGWHGASPLTLLRLPLVGECAMALARRWMLGLAMRPYLARTSRLTPEALDHYWWPFAHGFKSVLLSMVRERIGSPDDFARWRAALAAYPGAALIVWGLRDPTFGRGELDDVRSLLPRATVQAFPNANHFIPEDRPLALGRLIALFVAGEPIPNALPEG